MQRTELLIANLNELSNSAGKSDGKKKLASPELNFSTLMMYVTENEMKATALTSALFTVNRN